MLAISGNEQISSPGLTKLGSISEIVCYVASSNPVKFHAFITKENNFGRQQLDYKGRQGHVHSGQAAQPR